MRALASVGLFAQTPAGEFALTPRGALLRSDVPGSLRQLAIMLGQPWHGRACDALHDRLRAGGVPFEHVRRQPFFAFLAARPEAAENFNAAMTGFAEATHTFTASMSSSRVIFTIRSSKPSTVARMSSLVTVGAGR
jgi:hypothetical protein